MVSPAVRLGFAACAWALRGPRCELRTKANHGAPPPPHGGRRAAAFSLLGRTRGRGRPRSRAHD
eukprot:3939831-Prymnesium_polylepis.1